MNTIVVLLMIVFFVLGMHGSIGLFREKTRGLDYVDIGWLDLTSVKTQDALVKREFRWHQARILVLAIIVFGTIGMVANGAAN